MNPEKIYLKWFEVLEKWKTAPYTWIDVSIILKVEEIIGGAGNYGIAPNEYKFEPILAVKNVLQKKEYDRFIEIACKVNGITTKEVKQRKKDKLPIISIKEIQITVDAVKASVKISNIT